MIQVKFDPTISIPDIKMPIYSETEENDPEGKNYGSDYDTYTVQQTKLDGVMVPLVRLDNQTIFFNQIVDMRLSCYRVPELDITIDDQLGLIKNLDNPSWDNTLQLQILPPFDGAYKKINLLFYITDIKIDGSIIRISATYHIPNLWDHKMKAYGEITTYEYMEQVAKEYGLGFCSNVDSTNDKRYIYNPMMNQIDHINQTVSYAHDGVSDDVMTKDVFEWWIDYWNNLNLVNVYTEYKEILPEDNEYMQIWTVDKDPHIAGDDKTQNLVKMLAVFSNSPILQQSQLFINEYIPEFSTIGATDQIFDTYSMKTLEQKTTLIENGDVKDNLQQGYTYGGEVFGDYDYLARRAAKNMLMSKINAQTIKVSIPMPTLGLIKGGKVNVWWYDSGNYITGPITETVNDDIESNVELPPSLPIDDMGWIINKMISGQYYISDMTFRYHTQFQWSQEFTLSRDGKDINKYNAPQQEDSEKN